MPRDKTVAVSPHVGLCTGMHTFMKWVITQNVYQHHTDLLTSCKLPSKRCYLASAQPFQNRSML